MKTHTSLLFLFYLSLFSISCDSESFNFYAPCDLISDNEIISNLEIEPKNICSSSSSTDNNFEVCLRCFEDADGFDFVFDIFLAQNEDPNSLELDISMVSILSSYEEEKLENLGETARIYAVNGEYRAISFKEGSYLILILFSIDKLDQDQIKTRMKTICDVILNKIS